MRKANRRADWLHGGWLFTEGGTALQQQPFLRKTCCRASWRRSGWVFY
ncbi:MAG: hypothetical protein U5L45_20985 [Saprospiraceae bacterium]|nr:hypothetical protein [Saprospiraceae bacterium]